MTAVLAIDPGPTRSAYLECNLPDRPMIDGGIVHNDRLIEIVRSRMNPRYLAVEMVAHYGSGMAVGADVFETVVWIGRFVEAWRVLDRRAFLVKRTAIKMHLCGRTSATDANVRQALIDRWGGDEKAVGGKKCPVCKGKGWRGRGRPECEACGGSGWQTSPGPLAKFATHLWSALAVAVTWHNSLHPEEVRDAR
jgi:hypothetical protein